MTDPIGGIGNVGGMARPAGIGGAGGLPGIRPAALDPVDDGPSFADTLKRIVGEVSDSHGRAEDAIGGFLRGEEVELHEVMAAAEEAGIALEMLIEIRNKMAEAYRTVIGMQS